MGLVRLITLFSVLIACASVRPVFAQNLPGQYPTGQPGRYPPGDPRNDPRDPRNNPNDPRNDPRNNPRGNPKNAPRGGDRRGDSTTQKFPVTTVGMFRAAGGTQFVLEPEDHRIVTYRTTGQTTIRKDGKDADFSNFQPGDRLTVDSTEDDLGYFTATSVTWEKVGSSEDRALASRTWDLPRLGGAPAAGSSPPPTIRRDPGDDRPVLRRKEDPAKEAPAAQEEVSAAPTSAKDAPKEVAKVEEEPIDTRPTTVMRPADVPPDSDEGGPPKLKRGAPVRRPTPRVATSSGESTIGAVIKPREADPPSSASAPDPEPTRTAPAAPAESVPFVEDPLIRKAREVTESYSGSLPNFFCQQFTTRYQRDDPRGGWRAVDMVSADIAYENGRESYKNIKVGGKAVKSDMNDIEGSRSTGEFQTILASILSPGTAAVFRRAGSDTIRGRSTQIFKYEVTRERSNWRIESPAQIYFPAYSGSIWIDKETARVLRIEQQSRNMPKLFPFDTSEAAIDYDSVRLAATQPYVLPVSSEVLTCIRGTSICMRNRIEFRNYRKFGAESNITFDGKPPQE